MPRAKKPAKLITKTCGACHETFETTRPKATRCPRCISGGRKVRYRKCVECSSQFVLFDETHLNCPSCADMLGIGRFELSPEQLERLREEERLAKFLQDRGRDLEWLTRRNNARRKWQNNHNHPYDLTSLGLI